MVPDPNEVLYTGPRNSPNKCSGGQTESENGPLSGAEGRHTSTRVGMGPLTLLAVMHCIVHSCLG